MPLHKVTQSRAQGQPAWPRKSQLVKDTSQDLLVLPGSSVFPQLILITLDCCYKAHFLSGDTPVFFV